MSACETCWTEASRRALTAGGHTADHYRDLLAEHPEGHAQRDDEWVLCENCGVRDCYHQASVLMSTPPTALGRDLLSPATLADTLDRREGNR